MGAMIGSWRDLYKPWWMNVNLTQLNIYHDHMDPEVLFSTQFENYVFQTGSFATFRGERFPKNWRRLVDLAKA